MNAKDCFPKLTSYERFAHLISRAILLLTTFTQIKARRQTGVTLAFYLFVILNAQKDTKLLSQLQNMERPLLASSLG